jgi:hypothetical protein
MIKYTHIFQDNTSTAGNGTDLNISNKSALSTLVVSCGDLNNTPSATAATMTFYGKGIGSQEYIAIKGIKVSDYSLSYTGSLNESYYLDILGYDSIRVALSGVTGGTVSVIGEVIE